MHRGARTTGAEAPTGAAATSLASQWLPKRRGLTKPNSHVQKVKIESFIWNTLNEFLRRRISTTYEDAGHSGAARRSNEQRKQCGAGSAGQEEGKGKSEVRSDTQVRLLESLAWLKARQGLPSEAELRFRGEGTVTSGKGNGKPTNAVAGKRGTDRAVRAFSSAFVDHIPSLTAPFLFLVSSLQAGPQNS